MRFHKDAAKYYSADGKGSGGSDSGKDIELTVKTTQIVPTWMKILPVVGFGVGLFAAHKIGTKEKGKATLGQYLAFGSVGSWIFTAPILAVALSNIKKATSPEAVADSITKK